jgi:hypothetical protein
MGADAPTAINVASPLALELLQSFFDSPVLSLDHHWPIHTQIQKTVPFHEVISELGPV